LRFAQVLLANYPNRLYAVYMNFHLISLGCSKNTSDSEAIANQFARTGWKWCASPEKADLILINTCGFIKDAKEESLKKILQTVELKKQNPRLKVAAFGCLIKRYHSEIKKQISELDYLFDFLSEDNIALMSGNSGKSDIDYSQSWRFFTPPHIGILKIAEGCSNRCSYCAIPGIRGPFLSRQEQEILEDAQRLVNSGAVEISVVAQDITRYGTEKDGVCKLPALVKKISGISGISWIRLHYMHPRGLTTDLIDQLYSIPKVLPYFDIPFQHFADRMLRLMNRKTSPQHIINLIRHIRKNYRDAAIRTTFIVGFPGENDEDFSELIEFVERYPIDRVGAFAYSTEEGTSAALIVPKVPMWLKQNRLDQLMTLQQLLAEERNRRLAGRKVDLIVDEIEGEFAHCRTKWDAYEVDNLTTLVNKELKPGQIVKAKIKEAQAYDFTAELI